MSVAVGIESVDVELGGSPILRDVSVDVAAGELLTLLGPSGSGKTTTLNVIAGFVPAARGHVRFDGRPIDGVPVHRRDIGIVFQSYALFRHLPVGENVGFALRNRKVPRAERARAVDEMLALVRLDGMAARPVASLSGGQQQRVALARALVFRPKVLLLDEPLAALDRQLREAMQVELRRIQREIGVTTIGVTHDQVEAMTMSDRIAIMNAGRVEQIGTAEELYRRPATLFVARFLGEANLLDVDDDGHAPDLGRRVADRGGTVVVRPEDLALGDGDATAMVEQISYQGARHRILARTPAGTALVISHPDDAPPPAVGETVALRCRREELHVIGREPARAALR